MDPYEQSFHDFWQAYEQDGAGPAPDFGAGPQATGQAAPTAHPAPQSPKMDVPQPAISEAQPFDATKFQPFFMSHAAGDVAPQPVSPALLRIAAQAIPAPNIGTPTSADEMPSLPTPEVKPGDVPLIGGLASLLSPQDPTRAPIIGGVANAISDITRPTSGPKLFDALAQAQGILGETFNNLITDADSQEKQYTQFAKELGAPEAIAKPAGAAADVVQQTVGATGATANATLAALMGLGNEARDVPILGGLYRALWEAPMNVLNEATQSSAGGLIAAGNLLGRGITDVAGMYGAKGGIEGLWKPGSRVQEYLTQVGDASRKSAHGNPMDVNDYLTGAYQSGSPFEQMFTTFVNPINAIDIYPIGALQKARGIARATGKTILPEAKLLGKTILPRMEITGENAPLVVRMLFDLPKVERTTESAVPLLTAERLGIRKSVWWERLMPTELTDKARGYGMLQRSMDNIDNAMMGMKADDLRAYLDNMSRSARSGQMAKEFFDKYPGAAGKDAQTAIQLTGEFDTGAVWKDIDAKREWARKALAEDTDTKKMPVVWRNAVESIRKNNALDAETVLDQVAKVDLRSQWGKHVATAIKDRLGIKNAGVIQKMMDSVRAWEGALYIGMNPGSWLRNGWDNKKNMVVYGINPRHNYTKIQETYRALGWDPFEAMRGEIKATISPEGTRGAYGASIPEKLHDLLPWYQNMERADNLRAYWSAFDNAQRLNWARGNWFKRMPHGLEKALDGISPRLSNIVYGAIEAGRSPAQVLDNLNNIFNQIHVNAFLDDPDFLKAMGDALGANGALDEQTARLIMSTHADGINEAIGRAFKRTDVPREQALGEELNAYLDELVGHHETLRTAEAPGIRKAAQQGATQSDPDYQRLVEKARAAEPKPPKAVTPAPVEPNIAPIVPEMYRVPDELRASEYANVADDKLPQSAEELAYDETRRQLESNNKYDKNRPIRKIEKDHPEWKTAYEERWGDAAAPAPSPKAEPPQADTASAPVSASVPVLITRDMRQQLADLGYSRAEIDAMKPQDANDILAAGTTKPRVSSAPVQGVEPPIAAEPTPRVLGEFTTEEQAQINAAATNALPDRLQKWIADAKEYSAAHPGATYQEFLDNYPFSDNPYFGEGVFTMNTKLAKEDFAQTEQRNFKDVWEKYVAPEANAETATGDYTGIMGAEEKALEAERQANREAALRAQSAAPTEEVVATPAASPEGRAETAVTPVASAAETLFADLRKQVEDVKGQTVEWYPPTIRDWNARYHAAKNTDATFSQRAIGKMSPERLQAYGLELAQKIAKETTELAQALVRDVQEKAQFVWNKIINGDYKKFGDDVEQKMFTRVRDGDRIVRALTQDAQGLDLTGLRGYTEISPNVAEGFANGPERTTFEAGRGEIPAAERTAEVSGTQTGEPAGQLPANAGGTDLGLGGRAATNEGLSTGAGAPSGDTGISQAAIVNGPTAEPSGAANANAEPINLAEQPSASNPLVADVTAPTEATNAKEFEPSTARSGASVEGQRAPDSGADVGSGPVENAAPDSGANNQPVQQPAAAGRESKRGVGTGERRVRSVPATPDGEPVAGTARSDHSDAGGRDYVITESDALGQGGEKTKFRQNVRAIELVNELEGGKRFATPEEQAELVKYVGWGGLSNKGFFNPREEAQIRQMLESSGREYTENYLKRWDADWGKEKLQLLEALNPEDYAQARASTLNAHYTSQVVIKAMWEAIRRLGWDGGKMLEPAVGVGHFFGLMPTDLAARTARVGVDKDALSARIAKQLYQRSNVMHAGFEEVKFPDNYFSLGVSNIPFGNIVINDPRYNSQRFLLSAIHDYYFAKMLDKTEPGGIVSFITSHFTMDKQDARVRNYIADRADLVGMIRLPNDAFKGNAGTEVVTDIVFLRKRFPDEPASGESFRALGEVNGFGINEYYQRHPEMMLGEWTDKGSMYGKNEMTLTPIKDADLAAQLKEAVGNLPEGVYDPHGVSRYDLATAEQFDTAMQAARTGRMTQLKVEKGKAVVVGNGAHTVIEATPKELARIKAFDDLRNQWRETLDAWRKPETSDADAAAALQRLNDKYNTFTKDFGYINSRTNNSFFRRDDDLPNLRALENPVEGTKNEFERADALLKRTIFPPEKRTYKIETAQDALVTVLNENGRVDLKRMAELANKPVDTLKEELRGRIFRNPDGDWETADAYLSGNVREKLRAAESAAQVDEAFGENADALRNIIPADLPPEKIEVDLGAPWMGSEPIRQFIAEMTGNPARSIRVEFQDPIALWKFDTPGYFRDASKQADWNTDRYTFYNAVDDAANHRSPTIFDTHRDSNGDTVKTLNTEQTTAARALLDKVKREYSTWIWKDENRAAQIARAYNDKFNGFVERKYDGSHLTFPGMSPVWRGRMYPHQQNGIWRALASPGNTLLSHSVGSGKSLQLASIVMEAKRLGIAKKSVLLTEKNLVSQLGAQIREIYPGARVLMATEKDFDAANRRAFMARIANGDWDAIVMSHSQFNMLPVSPETYNNFVGDEINRAVRFVEMAKAEMGKGDPSIKEIEKHIENLRTRMANYAKSYKKDVNINFEELGIDQVVVDESHNFKRLWFQTKMGRVRGVQPDGSERAFNLYIKLRHLNEQNNGRGIVFATGTPLSNTLAEIYTLQRFLAPQQLEELGIDHFDAWAHTFGKLGQYVEPTPDGTRLKVITAFRQFQNVRQLSSLFRQFADVILTKDLIAADVLKNMPKLENNAHIIIKTQPTAEFTAFQQKLLEMMRAFESHPTKDTRHIPLWVLTKGNLASVDMRLIDSMFDNNPDSKLNVAARQVYDVWKETHADNKTQLVFINVGVPGGSTPFNTYEHMRKSLIELGIPANEVEFRVLASGASQKVLDDMMAQAERVKSGKTKVLIGSYPSMGQGLNVQEHLYAVHHIDVPWRPDQIEQADGRIIRQGNTNPRVRVYRYVTERSTDMNRWTKIEQKSRMVEQFLKGELDANVMDDPGAISSESAAEIAAAASGNPMLVERALISSEAQNLEMQARAHVERTRKARFELATLPQTIDAKQKDLEFMQAAIEARIPAAKTKDFRILVGGSEYAEKEAAGAEVLRLANAFKDSGADMPTLRQGHPIGTYRGMEMLATIGVDQQKVYPVVRFVFDGQELAVADASGESAAGMITRLNNALDGLDARADKLTEQIGYYRNQLIAQQKISSSPFEYQQRLDDIRTRISEIDKAMNPDDKLNKAMDALSDEGEEVAPADAGFEGLTEADATDEMATENAPQQAPAPKAVKPQVQAPVETLPNGKQVQRVQDNYYRKYGNNFEKIEKASPVEIPGLEGRDIFVAKIGSEWIVTDGYTGARIGGGLTKSEAIAKVSKAIEERGAAIYDRGVSEILKDTKDLSPRYQYVESETMFPRNPLPPESATGMTLDAGVPRFTDDLARLSYESAHGWKKKHWESDDMPGASGPNMADGTASEIDTLQKLMPVIQKQVLDAALKQPVVLDPLTARALMDYVQKEVNPAFQDATAAANVIGKWNQQRALLNYDQRTNFDEWLSYGFPFLYWRRAQAWNWLLRIMEKPNLWNGYVKAQHMLDDMTNSDEYPARLRGKLRLPMPGMEPWMGGNIFFNPLEMFMPMEALYGTEINRAKYGGANSALLGLPASNDDIAKILRSQAQTGQVSRADAENAIATRKGDLWEGAKQTAQQDVASPDNLSGLFTPHTPIQWLIAALTDQTDSIGPLLPISRPIRQLTGALGINNGAGVNIEAPARNVLRAVGLTDLPEFDPWEEYRVRRQLADMVGTKLNGATMTEKDARLAMMEKRGVWWNEAQRRANAEQMPLFSMFTPTKVLPTGETQIMDAQKHLNALKNSEVRRLGGNANNMTYVEREDYLKTHDAYAQDSALRKFYDANSGLEARSALFRQQEERLKRWMIDELWTKYNDLTPIDKRAVRAELGDSFETLFADKATRDYNQIPLLDLIRWGQQMDTQIPNVPKGDIETLDLAKMQPPKTLEYAPAEVAAAYTNFVQAMGQQFDGDEMARLSNEYKALTDSADKKDFMARYPMFYAYLTAWSKFYDANPQVEEFLKNAGALGESKSTAQNPMLDPNASQAQKFYYTVVAAGLDWDRMKAKQAMYSALPKGTGARTAYLKANPDYFQYYQLRNAFFGSDAAENGSALFSPTGSSSKKNEKVWNPQDYVRELDRQPYTGRARSHNPNFGSGEMWAALAQARKAYYARYADQGSGTSTGAPLADSYTRHSPRLQ